jgi:uncharacterized membrane protein
MELPLLFILTFAGIGMLDTIYLTYHAFKKTLVYCPFFPDEWCKKVQFSKQSRLFGFPNAYAGLGMYIGILLGVWLFLQSLMPFWPVATIILIGFLFSMYFIYVQAAQLKAFCFWCILSAINFSVMLIAMMFV